MALTVCETAAAECLNSHSQAVKLTLDNDFEDWDFFADDFDKRVRYFFVFLVIIVYFLTRVLMFYAHF